MNENNYFGAIIYHLGFAINNKNNSKIILNYSIKNENKSLYYSINPFSDFPGEAEKEIYNFLANKKIKVNEYNLMIPFMIIFIHIFIAFKI